MSSTGFDQSSATPCCRVVPNPPMADILHDAEFAPPPVLPAPPAEQLQPVPPAMLPPPQPAMRPPAPPPASVMPTAQMTTPAPMLLGGRFRCQLVGGHVAIRFTLNEER